MLCDGTIVCNNSQFNFKSLLSFHFKIIYLVTGRSAHNSTSLARSLHFVFTTLLVKIIIILIIGSVFLNFLHPVAYALPQYVLMFQPFRLNVPTLIQTLRSPTL